MKIMTLNAQSILPGENHCLALGFFDGVHRAHRDLLSRTISMAKQNHLTSSIMTFSTHVLTFLRHESFSMLSRLEDKIALAELYGFDYFFVLEVDSALVQMPPTEFIARFLKKASIVVAGFDFTFGHRGKGTVETLQAETSFQTIILPEITYYRKKIGSTRIREMLKLGRVETAMHLIGEPYRIQGMVIRGKGRGTGLGFPTANIDFDGYLLPKPGVYLSKVTIDGIVYDALSNIGDNPTFGDEATTLETYLLDFNGSLYGKRVAIAFTRYLRPEIRFGSKAELIKQMLADEQNARKILSQR
jgi:riboflavin kinase/FMN adenylyltransferase